MNKKLATLAGAGLGLGLILGTPHVSLAQAGAASGPFADVPADHWAYQAVDTLQKAGIVIGYPDGTYGGKRAMTRYEFAVAIARLLPLIQKIDTSQFATKPDLDALRNDINGRLAQNQQAIDALRALVNEFQPELQRLGQDVAAIQQRLNALEARLAAVEEEQRRVKINGALDLIARADNSRTNVGGLYAPFVDQNGVGTGRGLGLGNPALGGSSNRLLQTSDVYHNFALTIRGKLTDTATANARIEFGNYLPAVGNTAATGYNAGTFLGNGLTGRDVSPGTLTGADSIQTHLREAYLDAPVALGPLGGAQVQVGRIPVQFSKYTLMQPDVDVYTNLYETDSGNVPTDGGKLAFKLGPVAIQGFAGKNDTIPFAQPYGGSQGIAGGAAGFGTQFRPTGMILENHAAAFTQSTGARATIGSPNAIQISGTVVHAGLTNDTLGGGGSPVDPENGRSYNKLTVYGADANGALPFGKSFGLGVDASYAISFQGGTKNHTGSNYRYQSNEEQLSAQFGGLNLKGGYQYVGPYFSAPGYWGKVGAWTNPTNVQGPIVAAKYAFTPRLTLKANAQFYRAAYGTQANGVPISSPLQQDDRVTRYQVGLGFGLTSNNAVDLGYEDVTYDLKNVNGTLFAAGKPHESYLTFGLGHSFNNNASLKLLYQIINYSDKGTGFDPVDRDGGVAVGQFQIKF